RRFSEALPCQPSLPSAGGIRATLFLCCRCLRRVWPACRRSGRARRCETPDTRVGGGACSLLAPGWNTEGGVRRLIFRPPAVHSSRGLFHSRGVPLLLKGVASNPFRIKLWGIRCA